MYDEILLRTVETFGRLFGGFTKNVAKTCNYSLLE